MIAIPAFALSVLISQFIGQKLADSLVYQASRTVRADFMKGKGFGNMQLGSDSDTDMFMQTKCTSEA
ncbi:TPA: hypothetical protein ACJTDZ_000460 [Streptococcus agalactiae]